MLYMQYDYTLLDFKDEDTFNKYKTKYKFSPDVKYDIVKNKQKYVIVGISKRDYMMGYIWLDMNHPICRKTFTKNIAFIRELLFTYKKEDIDIAVYKAVTKDIEAWLNEALDLSGVTIAINKLDIKERNKYVKLNMKPILNGFIYTKPITDRYNLNYRDSINDEYIGSKLLDVDTPTENITRYIFSTNDIDICNLYQYMQVHANKVTYVYTPYEASTDLWKANLKHINIIYYRLFNNKELEIIPNIKEDDLSIMRLYPYSNDLDLKKYFKLISILNHEAFGDDVHNPVIIKNIDYFSKHNNIFYIFTYRKRFAGYIWFSKNNTDVYKIELFAICKEYRNRNIGNEILTKLIHSFKVDKTCNRIDLTVSAVRPNAIKLYKNVGFIYNNYCKYKLTLDTSLNETYLKSIIDSFEDTYSLVERTSINKNDFNKFYICVYTKHVLSTQEMKDLINFLHVKDYRNSINIDIDKIKYIYIFVPLVDTIPQYKEFEYCLKLEHFNMTIDLT